MTDSIFYELLWITIIFLWLRYARFYRNDPAFSLILQSGFLLKVAFGFFFLFVYRQFYQSSDAYAFLDDSLHLTHVFNLSPATYFAFLTGIGNTTEMVQTYLSETTLWSKGPTTLFNDSQNIIRINSLIGFISHGNPNIHVIFMSFFSILGLRDLAIAFRKRILVNPKILFAGLILIPSVLFWTSGILKEPFMLLGIGFLLRGLLADETRWKRILRIVLGILVLLCIKPYILVCIAFAAVYYIFNSFFLKNKPVLGLGVYMGILALLTLAFPKLRNDLAVNLSVKQTDSYNVGKGGLYVIRDSVQFYYFQNSEVKKLTIRDSVAELKSPAHAEQKWIYKRSYFQPVELTPNGEKWKLYLLLDSSTSLIKTTPINKSFTQLVRNTPEAFTNALLRPFPSDSGSKFKYPAIAEVFLIVSVLAFAVFFRRKLDTGERRLLIGLILFTVSLSILIGWTTPVIGAIVRYRIPAYMAIFIISIFVLRIPDTWKKQTQ